MTHEEIVGRIKTLYEKRAAITALHKQRQDAEIALNIEYRVEECNIKKNALHVQYGPQVQALSREIYAIESEMGVKDGL